SPLFSVFSATGPPDTSALPLHDALPIWPRDGFWQVHRGHRVRRAEILHDRRSHAALPRPRSNVSASSPVHSGGAGRAPGACRSRSEEHTSELQSRENLVCRLLLEKKNTR